MIWIEQRKFGLRLGLRIVIETLKYIDSRTTALMYKL